VRWKIKYLFYSFLACSQALGLGLPLLSAKALKKQALCSEIGEQLKLAAVDYYLPPFPLIVCAKFGANQRYV